MQEESPTDSVAKPPPVPSGPGEYRALRSAGRGLLALVLLSCLVYFNLTLLPMVGHTLIPFAALFAIGGALGLVSPKRRAATCFFAWWLVVFAVILRRGSMGSVPLERELFDGALFKAGYPNWAARVSEVLRLGVYLYALELGGRVGARFRRAPERTGP